MVASDWIIFCYFPWLQIVNIVHIKFISAAMAVKQYTNENNQRPENLKYNISKILEYIVELENSLVNSSSEPDLLIICKKIVDLLGKFFIFHFSMSFAEFFCLFLGHVDVPTKKELISPFREQIKKVDNFLEVLLKNDKGNEIIQSCLRQLYQNIMSIGELYLSFLLVYVPVAVIVLLGFRYGLKKHIRYNCLWRFYSFLVG